LLLLLLPKIRVSLEVDYLAAIGKGKDCIALHGCRAKFGRNVWAKELRYLNVCVDEAGDYWARLFQTNQDDYNRATIPQPPPYPTSDVAQLAGVFVDDARLPEDKNVTDEEIKTLWEMVDSWIAKRKEDAAAVVDLDADDDGEEGRGGGDGGGGGGAGGGGDGGGDGDGGSGGREAGEAGMGTVVVGLATRRSAIASAAAVLAPAATRRLAAAPRLATARRHNPGVSSTPAVVQQAAGGGVGV